MKPTAAGSGEIQTSSTSEANYPRSAAGEIRSPNLNHLPVFSHPLHFFLFGIAAAMLASRMAKKSPPNDKEDGERDIQHDVAFDHKGAVEPMDQQDVAYRIEYMMAHGDPVLTIWEYEGEIAVQIFGQPTPELGAKVTAALQNLKAAIAIAAARSGRPQ